MRSLLHPFCFPRDRFLRVSLALIGRYFYRAKIVGKVFPSIFGFLETGSKRPPIKGLENPESCIVEYSLLETCS